MFQICNAPASNQFACILYCPKSYTLDFKRKVVQRFNEVGSKKWVVEEFGLERSLVQASLRRFDSRLCLVKVVQIGTFVDLRQGKSDQNDKGGKDDNEGS